MQQKSNVKILTPVAAMIILGATAGGLTGETTLSTADFGDLGPTLLYPIDMAAVVADFADDSRFTLPTPEGLLELEGTEIQIVENNDDDYGVEQANGSIVYYDDPSIALAVNTTNPPGGAGWMLLGQYGAYGNVVMAYTQVGEIVTHREHWFNAEEVSPGVFLQGSALLVRQHHLSVGANATLSTALPAPAACVTAVVHPTAPPLATGPQPANTCATVVADPAPVVENLTEPDDDQVEAMAAKAKPGDPWPCTPVQKYVTIHVELSFKNTHTNWVERAKAAFVSHHGSYEMWKDICLELLIKAKTPVAMACDVGASNERVNVLDSYEAYLGGGVCGSGTNTWRTNEANGYSMWTTKNLEDSNGNKGVAGTANTDTAVLSPAATAASRSLQREAVSVMEDWKPSGTAAQVASIHGRLQGHELTHLFGGGGHAVGDCKTSSVCNIMDTPQTMSTNKEYWVQKHRCEVYRYVFHSGDTAWSTSESCTDYYSP